MKKISTILATALMLLAAIFLYTNNADNNSSLQDTEDIISITIDEVPEEKDFKNKNIYDELKYLDIESNDTVDKEQPKYEDNADVLEDILEEDANIKKNLVENKKDYSGLYYYDHLNDLEKETYSLISDTIINYEESVIVNTVDDKLIDKAFNAVCLDNPNIFYTNGYGITTNRIATSIITPHYTYEKSKKEAIEKQLEIAKAEIVEKTKVFNTDYDKIKFVYEEIINKTEYCVSPDDQNIVSVLLNHKSVCKGYSSAFQAILYELGIPCIVDIGITNENQPHAWNLCEVEGKWYYIDVTWGDPAFDNSVKEEAVNMYNGVDYEYFLVPYSEIKDTHISDKIVEMPQATSIEHNYYVREGLYLYDYSLDVVRVMIQNQQELGAKTLRIKCATDAVYNAAIFDLVDEQRIFEVLPGDNTYYSASRETKTILFAL